MQAFDLWETIGRRKGISAQAARESFRADFELLTDFVRTTATPVRLPGIGSFRATQRYKDPKDAVARLGRSVVRVTFADKGNRP